MQVAIALFLSLVAFLTPALADEPVVPPSSKTALAGGLRLASAPAGTPFASAEQFSASAAQARPLQVAAARASAKDAPKARKKAEEKAQEKVAEKTGEPKEAICETLASAAAEHDLPVIFFTRLIWQESKFDPLAVSHAGAQGVAQFMPRVAAAMGLSDPFDPAQALPMSARLLSDLYRQFGNWGLAAAAYNAGASRVRAWLDSRGKLPKETRNYVHSITGLPAESWKKPSPGSVALTPPKKTPCENLPAVEIHSAGMAVPIPPPRPQAVVAVAKRQYDGAQDLAAQTPTEFSASARRPQEEPEAWSVLLAPHLDAAQASAMVDRLGLASLAPTEQCERAKGESEAEFSDATEFSAARARPGSLASRDTQCARTRAAARTCAGR